MLDMKVSETNPEITQASASALIRANNKQEAIFATKNASNLSYGSPRDSQENSIFRC